jgi:RHS repeat-associated protein
MWRWDSDPFGTTLANENPSGLGVFSYGLRFPGQYYDSETGLHYNYFRDYDPATGRYIESDPIGLEGGVNTYSYAQSSPALNADSSGLFAGPPPATVAGNALGAAWAVGTIAGTVIYNAFADQIQDRLESAFPYERSWRERRGRWKVYVRCNVTAFGSGCECPPPATIGGWAYGNTFGQAFANAQHDANANLGDLGKRSCYPRHCQPVACFESNRPVPCPKSGR